VIEEVNWGTPSSDVNTNKIRRRAQIETVKLLGIFGSRLGVNLPIASQML